ncbi:unnamed protein product, partial [Amoebophrya sp. A25]
MAPAGEGAGSQGGLPSTSKSTSKDVLEDIFVRDTFILRAALVASCSPQIVHGGLQMNPLHLQAMLGMHQLKNPFRHCCMLPNLAPELRAAPRQLQRSLSTAFGSECQQIAVFEETPDVLAVMYNKRVKNSNGASTSRDDGFVDEDSSSEESDNAEEAAVEDEKNATDGDEGVAEPGAKTSEQPGGGHGGEKGGEQDADNKPVRQREESSDSERDGRRKRTARRRHDSRDRKGKAADNLPKLRAVRSGRHSSRNRSTRGKNSRSRGGKKRRRSESRSRRDRRGERTTRPPSRRRESRVRDRKASSSKDKSSAQESGPESNKGVPPPPPMEDNDAVIENDAKRRKIDEEATPGPGLGDEAPKTGGGGLDDVFASFMEEVEKDEAEKEK